MFYATSHLTFMPQLDIVSFHFFIKLLNLQFIFFYIILMFYFIKPITLSNYTKLIQFKGLILDVSILSHFYEKMFIITKLRLQPTKFHRVKVPSKRSLLFGVPQMGHLVD